MAQINDVIDADTAQLLAEGRGTPSNAWPSPTSRKDCSTSSTRTMRWCRARQW